jgi:hypothetical protein
MRKEMKVRKMGSVSKGRAFMSTSNIHELILEGALGTTEEKGGWCWWEKPLVVALKHSEGIKHTVLFQEQKLTNN